MTKNRFISFIYPRQNEFTLYLLSISLILIGITNFSSIANSLIEIHTKNTKDLIGVVVWDCGIVVYIYGALLPIYHVFSSTIKTEKQKKIMLQYSMTVYMLSGIIPGLIMLTNFHTLSWLIIFPIWNTIQGFILMIIVKYNMITTYQLSNDNTSIWKTIVGTILLLFIFGISHLVMHNSADITLNICISFITFIQKITDYFYPLPISIINNDQDTIKEFLNKNNTIAIIGASNNSDKYGYKIFKDLKEYGYHVIPIHPSEPIMQGEKAYKILSEVPEPIDVVTFVIPPQETLKVLQECLFLGLKNVWFQPGASNDDVWEYCELNGFRYIHDQCVMLQKLNI